MRGVANATVGWCTWIGAAITINNQFDLEWCEIWYKRKSKWRRRWCSCLSAAVRIRITRCDASFIKLRVKSSLCDARTLSVHIAISIYGEIGRQQHENVSGRIQCIQGNEKNVKERSLSTSRTQRKITHTIACSSVELHKRNEEQVPFAMHQRKHSNHYMHELRPAMTSALTASHK